MSRVNRVTEMFEYNGISGLDLFEFLDKYDTVADVRIDSKGVESPLAVFVTSTGVVPVRIHKGDVIKLHIDEAYSLPVTERGSKGVRFGTPRVDCALRHVEVINSKNISLQICKNQ